MIANPDFKEKQNKTHTKRPLPKTKTPTRKALTCADYLFALTPLVPKQQLQLLLIT